MRTGQAKAHSNMALIKYWGKRHEVLKLPANSNLSMTLDGFKTDTSVRFTNEQSSDAFYLNDQVADNKAFRRVSLFLDIARKQAGITDRAVVTSNNNFPTAAGLASSASGFAALAGAVSQALQLPTDGISLSRLARLGSGSATRSIHGGYVKWHKGTAADGADSYATKIAEQTDWPLSMVIASVATEKKAVPSTEGMKRCVDTSPYYQGWLGTIEDDLSEAEAAISEKDIERLGMVMEANTMKMHALPLSATPPFTYWQPATVSVMTVIQQLRHEGIPAYYTMDAGPNVAVLCEGKHQQHIHDTLRHIDGVEQVNICRTGSGIQLG